MHILGIETSCDETAIAVIKTNASSITVLSNVVSSQIAIHAPFGGVVPHLAAREHEKNLPFVLRQALTDASLTIEDTDLIAVTTGPGLAPALLRGLQFSKELARTHTKPLVGINHMEGHVYSSWLLPVGHTAPLLPSPDIFPILHLIVSGGHTELVIMHDHGSYRLIGETLDDAVGEAFDKVARLLGLGYPGGPALSSHAVNGNPNRFPLPSPMAHSRDLNFSYSGLKTAVLYLTQKQPQPLDSQTVADICASFQKAALDILVQKTLTAADQYSIKTVYLSGGVSANHYLREQLVRRASETGIAIYKPDLAYTGDNGAMIALAGYLNVLHKQKDPHQWESLDIDARASLTKKEHRIRE